ncbi:hypothetical protein PMAYCL1PPCAC_25489, partial [Pristionchus mayeri]
SWDSILRRPLERICHFLFNAYDGTDVANLAKVSHLYNNVVMKFMRGPKNRPGIDRMSVRRWGDELLVRISLFPSNLPFYNLATLDKGRFRRMRDNGSPDLVVEMNGAEDPILEKVISLLSTSISSVLIASSDLSSSHLSMCDQLLRSSTIGALKITSVTFNDTTAPLTLSIASNAMDLKVGLTASRSSQHLLDPEAFISQLYSMPLLSSVSLFDLSYPFFGLTDSFWENYLNEKLSKGSFEWVEV